MQNYGCHLGPVETPLHEGIPRYEDHGLNFYYSQEDFMFRLHAQRKWSWNVIRPGGIVGFTPGSKIGKNPRTSTKMLTLHRKRYV